MKPLTVTEAAIAAATSKVPKTIGDLMKHSAKVIIRALTGGDTCDLAYLEDQAWSKTFKKDLVLLQDIGLVKNVQGDVYALTPRGAEMAEYLDRLGAPGNHFGPGVLEKLLSEKI